MTEVKAHLRHLRMSARKVRLATDLIRGLAVDQALTQLAFLNKAAARPVRKLLESAVANAVHNFHLDRASLFVQAIFANEGPTLKRFRPRAMGSAAPILKRSSHVTIVLGSKEAPKAKKTEEKEEKTEKKATKKTAAKPSTSAKATVDKAAPKKTLKK